MRPEILEKLDRFRREALAREVPPADVERWLTTARPCATLSPHVDGPVVGRFGGPLTLPVGAPRPEGLDELHLIASLDLAALPADATRLPLPREGRLLLCAHPDALDAHGTAIHLPADTPVEEHPVERGSSPTDLFAELDAQLLRMGELRLRHDVSLPDHDSLVDPAAHPHAGELREAWREVRDTDLNLTKWSQIQLDGYAMDEYGELDPVQAAARAAAADHPAHVDVARPEDWVLLAQWHPDIDDWESAVVHWSLARQDVAARRFDRTDVSMFFAP
ncbi:DUF1963 domain-containing protein [Streptomyces sp. WMMB303]|uniref:DUF1963 domain-containing protein n=1 Tax=Streptomyces sp. WMMB303 TaxID=3034154 RepID=UPI0023EC8C61|nr:DUF1963 domain-containing protein [Streptomyces sp. WMMB303]MDF4251597.1 DUF1963 domain-containing protein [Streptomyces sp. WMMB303]